MGNRAAKIHRIDSKEDRISTLPEPILHHILCSLSQKEAIQTCVLSKAWRYVGCTRPKIEFFEQETLLPGFLSVLDRILQCYHDRNLRLEQFSLSMSDFNVGSDDAASILNKWIPIIMQNMAVESFDLSFYCRRKASQIEPTSLMFESDHIRNLSLQGCKLKSTREVRVYLKHLQALWLEDVYIPEQILDSILSNCPFIENVSVLYSKGFKRIKLLNNKHTKLKNFYFIGGHIYDDAKDDVHDVTIEIGDDMQTLRTIKIERCLFSVSHNKQLELARLTRLSLTRVQLSSILFSCNLHCLEELKLDQCSGIEEFKLSSRSMKSLDINNISRPFKASIDAPSIVSFLYEGILPQSISFVGATTNSDDFRKSKINLGSSSDEPSYRFNELYGLLKPLSQSEISLELDEIEICRFGKQLHIGVSDSSTNDHIVGVSEAKQLPVAVEHLRIKMSERNLHTSAPPFLNKLFRMFRPSFIYIIRFSHKNNEHLEIAKLLFMKKEKAQSYFWQGVLEGVSLQALYRNQSEWQPVKYNNFTQLSEKGVHRELELRIQLKWRE